MYLHKNWQGPGKWKKKRNPQQRADKKEKDEQRRESALKFMASLPISERPPDLPLSVVEMLSCFSAADHPDVWPIEVKRNPVEMEGDIQPMGYLMTLNPWKKAVQ